MKTVAVIPAYNEESRISSVIEEAEEYVDRVLVVDDASTDGTAEVAEETGAGVIVHEENRGYLEALKTGFQNADADVIITLDADGEMDPEYIPDLVDPIKNGKTDLVLGKRREIPRISERFLSFIASLFVNVKDTGTGYRALRKELAEKMELPGICPCGTFVLEVSKLGTGIKEIPVVNRKVEKERSVAWKHFLQFWHILAEEIKML